METLTTENHSDATRHAKLIDTAVRRIRDAVERFNPIAIVALFSGGHDSGTASLIAHEAGAETTLHINTGIGVEQTRDYVRETCANRDWNLKEYKATENVNARGKSDPQIYEDMVRQYGFPGPFMHTKMYNRLKERQLDRFERDIGAKSKRPVIYVSGLRADESVRRMGNVKSHAEIGLHKEGRKVWCSPIHDFTKSDCHGCMEYCGLKRNEVVDLIHKSGECLCGAFAQPGEFAELKMWFPDVAKRISDLEKEVRPKFPWGWEEPGRPEWLREKISGQKFMLGYDEDIWEQPLCHRCNLDARKINENKSLTVKRITDLVMP